MAVPGRERRSGGSQAWRGGAPCCACSTQCQRPALPLGGHHRNPNCHRIEESHSVAQEERPDRAHGPPACSPPLPNSQLGFPFAANGLGAAICSYLRAGTAPKAWRATWTVTWRPRLRLPLRRCRRLTAQAAMAQDKWWDSSTLAIVTGANKGIG